MSEPERPVEEGPTDPANGRPWRPSGRPKVLDPLEDAPKQPPKTILMKGGLASKIVLGAFLALVIFALAYADSNLFKAAWER